MAKNYQLKSIRVKNRLTQSDIAAMLGIPTSTYCQKENGQRKFTLEEAWRLSNILNEDIEDIFFYKPDSQYENTIVKLATI